MSADISLAFSECDHCGNPGGEVFSENYTGNMNRVVIECLDAAKLRGEGAWSRLSGVSARAAVGFLERALDHMEEHRERFKTMEPANGWGSVEGVHGVMYRLMQACRNNPYATVRVHT